MDFLRFIALALIIEALSWDGSPFPPDEILDDRIITAREDGITAHQLGTDEFVIAVR